MHRFLTGPGASFLRDGFEGASVDDIANASRVSKATLYAYFPDKRLMFIEVFRSELERLRSEANYVLDLSLPAEQLLAAVMRMVSEHLVSDFGARAFRLSVAEAERFPVLAREYYEAGPGKLRSHLVQIFEICASRDELEIADPELAADQLIELSSAMIHDRVLLLGANAVDDAMIDRVIGGALHVFMAAYGTGIANPAALKAAQ